MTKLEHHSLTLESEELTYSSQQLGWDIEYRQLQKGLFRAEMLGIELDRLSVVRECFNRRVQLIASPPIETLVFAIPLYSNSFATVNYRPIFNNTLVVGRPGIEYEYLSDENHDIVTIVCERDLILEALFDLGVDEPISLTENYLAISLNEIAVTEMRQIVNSILIQHRRSSILERRFNLEELEEMLTLFLTRKLIEAVAEKGSLSSFTSNKTPSIKKAREYIGDCLSKKITLGDICRNVGASPRTLQYNFLNTYGTTISEYIKLQRLNHARRLLKASSSKSVAEVAISSGFNHLGRFSSEYRATFLEYPSETLRR